MIAKYLKVMRRWEVATDLTFLTCLDPPFCRTNLCKTMYVWRGHTTITALNLSDVGHQSTYDCLCVYYPLVSRHQVNSSVPTLVPISAPVEGDALSHDVLPRDIPLSSLPHQQVAYKIMI
jgi:hypothetical protein